MAVLANDYYENYDGPQVITAVTQPENGGSVEVLVDNRLRFVPGEERVGSSYFSYTVDDRFTATDPEGNTLVVNSNHAVGPV